VKRVFFMLEENVHVRNRWFLGDFQSTDSGDRERLTGYAPCIGTFDIDPGDGGRPMDFSLTAYGLPIASKVLAHTISELAGNKVKLVDAHIRGYGEFKFVQCLNSIDCVDRTNSKFDVFEDDDLIASRRGRIKAFLKFVVRPESIPPDAHFFHAGGWNFRPIVSEEMKRIILSNGENAVKFLPGHP
jgi:hypothetical protein